MGLHRQVNKEIRRLEEEMKSQDWRSVGCYCPGMPSPFAEWQDKLHGLRCESIHDLQQNADLHTLKVLRDAYLQVAKQYLQSQGDKK